MIKTNQETVGEIKKIIDANLEQGTSVRIYLAGMGCSGPSFGLALDDKKDEDESWIVEGQEFVMQKEFFEQFGSFHVEYQDGGYIVEPDQLPEGMGGCASCAGCN